MSTDKPSLDGAYALETTEDSVRLYRDWAKTYDADFVEATDYASPGHVARLFAEAGGGGPILDVGAGTGVVAAELQARGLGPVDATDISPEMLEVARGKGLYRDLFTSDITKRIDRAEGTYAGVVCAGTFTLGHVGPEGFDEIIRVAAPGAQFAISINKAHFDARGFADKLDSLAEVVTDLRLPEVALYGPNATGEHSDDTGFIALFRKA